MNHALGVAGAATGAAVAVTLIAVGSVSAVVLAGVAAFSILLLVGVLSSNPSGDMGLLIIVWIVLAALLPLYAALALGVATSVAAVVSTSAGTMLGRLLGWASMVAPLRHPSGVGWRVRHAALLGMVAPHAVLLSPAVFTCFAGITLGVPLVALALAGLQSGVIPRAAVDVSGLAGLALYSALCVGWFGLPVLVGLMAVPFGADLLGTALGRKLARSVPPEPAHTPR